ncbi:hypothetical protein ACET3Z_019157 [Daucus carota]
MITEDILRITDNQGLCFFSVAFAFRDGESENKINILRQNPVNQMSLVSSVRLNLVTLGRSKILMLLFPLLRSHREASLLEIC